MISQIKQLTLLILSKFCLNRFSLNLLLSTVSNNKEPLRALSKFLIFLMEEKSDTVDVTGAAMPESNVRPLQARISPNF